MSKNIIIGAVVGAVIFAGGGFYAGMTYTKSSVPARGAFTAGQFGGAGGARGGRAGGGFVAGDILSKDATSLTLKLQDGSTKIVLLSASTTVTTTTQTPVSSLTTGTNVVVTGPANSDGSVTAGSVQVRPQMRQP